MNGLISKIQRYSTKDGPGIRSVAFAVGCPLRCKWCANPELIEGGEKILYHAQRCQRCGACVALSNGTITLGPEGCIIDRAACKNLKECAAACFYDAYEFLGTSYTPQELAAKLLRDKAFYTQSGGGVTYSGGEAALQAEFFLEVTELLKAEDIHIALDTCGYLPWAKLGPLVDAVDLVLYDIKAIDDEVHKQYTGVSNALILENARRIAESGKEMLIRLIFIPGVNDGEKEVAERLAFVAALPGAPQVDILKYHRLGAGKYKSLGLSEPMGNVPEGSDEFAEAVRQKAEDMGLVATIGG